MLPTHIQSALWPVVQRLASHGEASRLSSTGIGKKTVPEHKKNPTHNQTKNPPPNTHHTKKELVTDSGDLYKPYVFLLHKSCRGL